MKTKNGNTYIQIGNVVVRKQHVHLNFDRAANSTRHRKDLALHGEQLLYRHAHVPTKLVRSIFALIQSQQAGRVGAVRVDERRALDHSCGDVLLVVGVERVGDGCKQQVYWLVRS